MRERYFFIFIHKNKICRLVCSSFIMPYQRRVESPWSILPSSAPFVLQIAQLFLEVDQIPVACLRSFFQAPLQSETLDWCYRCYSRRRCHPQDCSWSPWGSPRVDQRMAPQFLLNQKTILKNVKYWIYRIFRKYKYVEVAVIGWFGWLNWFSVPHGFTSRFCSSCVAYVLTKHIKIFFM